MPASAFCTQVWTAAQPLPSILWPFWASDQVTKLAHHGLPGPTPGRLEVLVDLGAGVDALLVDALGELALGDLQGRGAEAARAARRRGRGVGHDGRHGARRDRARRPGRRLHEGQLVAALGRLGGVLGGDGLKESESPALAFGSARRPRRRRAAPGAAAAGATGAPGVAAAARRRRRGGAAAATSAGGPAGGVAV